MCWTTEYAYCLRKEGMLNVNFNLDLVHQLLDSAIGMAREPTGYVRQTQSVVLPLPVETFGEHLQCH